MPPELKEDQGQLQTFNWPMRKIPFVNQSNRNSFSQFVGIEGAGGGGGGYLCPQL